MKIHMVKKGDTLYFIAQKYKVPLEELIKANPEIANPDEIDVGMKVKIPAPSQPAYEMMHQHTVQQGDTLWKLSKAWGIPLSDMIKANPQLKNPNVLLTGEVVNIPKMPAAGGASHGAPDQTSPGVIPGKKNTAVMPEAVVQETPAAPLPAPAPEPVAVETPPAEPVPAPLPAMPQIETQHPYPMMFHQEIHEQDLFAQFPMPAVEAAAQTPAEPCPEQPAHTPYMPHTAPAATSYGHYGQYNPADWSGESAKQGDFGDISQTSPASLATGSPGMMPNAFHGIGPVQGHAMTGYMPYQPQGQVSPFASATPIDSDCGCGGPAAVQPFAGPAWPNHAAAQAVMPAAGMGWPAAPQYATAPTMVSPAAFHPCANMPASVAPGFPGSMNAYPAYNAVSPMAAMTNPCDPCAPYGHYGMPGGDDRYGISSWSAYPPLPPLPPIPQMMNDKQEGDASPLTLHGTEDETDSTPASPAKKRSASGKSKRKAASKAKTKRKESLPLIKW